MWKRFHWLESVASYQLLLTSSVQRSPGPSKGCLILPVNLLFLDTINSPQVLLFQANWRLFIPSFTWAPLFHMYIKCMSVRPMLLVLWAIQLPLIYNRISILFLVWKLCFVSKFPYRYAMLMNLLNVALFRVSHFVGCRTQITQGRKVLSTLYSLSKFVERVLNKILLPSTVHFFIT